MKKQLFSMMTALILVFTMVLTGCITIVTPTRAPESDPAVVTTKADEPTTVTEAPTEKPTDKPDEPATPEATTEAPTDKPTEPPFTPPEAKTFESIPVLAQSHAKNDWHSDIQRNMFWVEWPQFSVLGQDWPVFAEAIEKWNLSADKDGLIFYSDNLADAQKAFSPAMNNWEDKTTPYIQRADEKIFSVLLETVSYHGGAHPGTTYSQLNLDPQTGKKLALSDIAADKDALTEKALSVLEAQHKNNGNPFFDGYKDTFKGLLQKELGGEDAAGLSWVLLPDLLKIVVDEYILAPYAYGSVELEIPFYEDETLFLNADYYAAVSGEFKAFIKEDKSFNSSFQAGDREYYVTIADVPGSYYGDYEIMVGELMVKRDRGLGISGAWLLTRNDVHYAFVEYYYENGYSNIDVYKVAVNELKFLEEYSGEILATIKDPDHLLWQTFHDSIGTWTGYAKMKITEEGKLEADGPFMFNNKDDDFYKNGKRTLTTKKEVRAFSVDGSDKEIKIPAGTVLTPYETNYDSFMDVILPDGSLARIKYEKDSTNYSIKIDGVDQYELFDGIMYFG